MDARRLLHGGFVGGLGLGEGGFLGAARFLEGGGGLFAAEVVGLLDGGALDLLCGLLELILLPDGFQSLGAAGGSDAHPLPLELLLHAMEVLLGGGVVGHKVGGEAVLHGRGAGHAAQEVVVVGVHAGEERLDRGEAGLAAALEADVVVVADALLAGGVGDVWLRQLAEVARVAGWTFFAWRRGWCRGRRPCRR